MATPATYTRKYSYTGQPNQTFGGTAKSIARSSFKVSGNTTEPIGRITKITFAHRHTATNSASSAKTWKLKTQLVMPDLTITSDTVSIAINGTVKTYTNTFTTDLPTPEQFAAWTSAKIIKANNRTDSDLYWRATSDYPITVTVYFWSARDMVDGNEDPPTVDGIAVSDSAMIGSVSVKDKFGSCVQGKSDVTITGSYTLDWDYSEFIAADHTLTLTDSDGNMLYTATQSDSSEFHIGAIDASGTVNIAYTVTDNGGLSDSGAFTMTVLPYTEPNVTNLTVERFTLDADGNPVASEDGEYVWISLEANVYGIGDGNQNGWTLNYAYSGADSASGVYASGTGYRHIAVSRADMFAGKVFDASAEWTFNFTLTDTFTSAGASAVLDEASAFFNVYPNGAAVGMRGTGTANGKRFEVAPDHESSFYGGIAGVTNYVQGEQPTNGRWIDGSPILRYVYFSDATIPADTAVTLFTLPNVANIIRLYGSWSSTGGYKYPLNIYLPENSEYSWARLNNTGEFRFKTKADVGKVIVIIEYTKTTALRQLVDANGANVADADGKNFIVREE